MKCVSKRLVAALVLMTALCVLLLAACADDEAKKPETDDTTTTAAITVTTQPTTGTTQKGFAGNGVGVRDEPGLNGSNIDTLYDQEVTIVDKHGDWYEIEYKDPYGEDKKGYVSGQVIEIVGNPNASQMQDARPTSATTTTVTVATDENGDTVTTTTNTDGRVEGIPITGIEDDPNF